MSRIPADLHLLRSETEQRGSEVEGSSAGWWREDIHENSAKNFRRKAAGIRSPELRESFLLIAAGYEFLAKLADTTAVSCDDSAAACAPSWLQVDSSHGREAAADTGAPGPPGNLAMRGIAPATS